MKKPAFTLIELTITIAILGLTLTITGGVLLSVVKSFQKQNELQRIERNGDVALRMIEEKVRKAKSIDSLTVQGSPAIQIFSDDDTSEIIGLSKRVTCRGLTNGSVFIVSEDDFTGANHVANDTQKITDDSDNGGTNIESLVLNLVPGKPIQVSATINVESSTCKADADKITKSFETFVTARGSY